MASRTKVVLNLVGPYTLYGRPVIQACVAHGAHYVDLTGEIPFVAQIIEAYDDRARNAGVKVVQVCGFEALPPDLAVQLAARGRARALGRGPCRGRPRGERGQATGPSATHGHGVGRDDAEPGRGDARRGRGGGRPTRRR